MYKEVFIFEETRVDSAISLEFYVDKNDKLYVKVNAKDVVLYDDFAKNNKEVISIIANFLKDKENYKYDLSDVELVKKFAFDYLDVNADPIDVVISKENKKIVRFNKEEI